jgi:hypothetical protein
MHCSHSQQAKLPAWQPRRGIVRLTLALWLLWIFFLCGLNEAARRAGRDHNAGAFDHNDIYNSCCTSRHDNSRAPAGAKFVSPWWGANLQQIRKSLTPPPFACRRY